MKYIVQIKYGSHLYGTATKDSDLDIKAVYLPTARDILLQRVQPVISSFEAKVVGNKADKIDFEAYSPEKFLRLLAEGQTVALDMMFATEDFILTKPAPLWNEIQDFATKILNKKVATFVRYCRQQANKYGNKGSRVAAVRQALELLVQMEDQYGSAAKLSSITFELEKLRAKREFFTIGEVSQPDGSKTPYFEICGKKALLGASIKSARVIAQNLLDGYGARALAAEKNEGIDWKALSHAVRVAHEAIEFLVTHKITFPRPEASHLLAIKQGKLPYKSVAEEIETLLEKLELAVKKSTLPEIYNEQAIDDFIEKLHYKIIATGAT